MTATLHDQGAAVRELVRRHGFRFFIERFWAEIEAVRFVDSWHIGAVAEVLQAVIDGQIRRIVINQPPGTSKSTLVSVMWPAWVWTVWAECRFLATAFDSDLVLRDAGRMLEIVKSEVYRAAWPEVRLVKPNPPEGKFVNTARGRRRSVQLGGGLTGWHGDVIILDDPIKPNDADAVSGEALVKTNNLVTKTLSSRLLEGPRAAVVCIMQRLADGDPADLLLDQGYEHLMLPMRYKADAYWDRGCSLGKLDPRTEEGELLCPVRFDEAAVERLEKGLGDPQAVAAQHDQNPTPKTGAFFEEAWFGEYQGLPKGLRLVQSWDLGFKGKRGAKSARKAHSRVHGALYAWDLERYYLVDEVIGTWNYPETKRKFRAQQTKELWDCAEAILVEDKANGIALIDELKAEFPLILPIEPIGSKEDRAARHSATVEAGLFLLPKGLPWGEEFKTELIKFPRQQHNDRVDTFSQAFDYMKDRLRRHLAALESIADQMREEGWA